MNEKSFRTPWGPLTSQQISKFGLLAITFFVIICSYWTLKSIKDPIFSFLVGIKFQPKAKILSVFFIFFILLIYSKLVDILKRSTLFYSITFFYVIVFTIIGYIIKAPLDRTTEIVPFTQAFGWLLYVTIESFGSIMVALFWAFTTGEVSVTDGKKGFPIIIFISQLGSILGPTLVTGATHLGLANLLFITCGTIIFIPFLIKIYLSKNYSKAGNFTEEKPKKKSTGIFEGIKIIGQNKYVWGIVGISTLHEVVVTIMDYKMKYLATQQYPNAEDFAVFMGHYGQAVNFFAFLWAMLGSSFLLRKFGLRFCLLLYPIVIAGIVVFQIFVPELWIFAAGMIAFKVLNYSLNNPAKEILYVPTDHDVRYKAKSWIDTFGARLAKAFGSLSTDLFKHSFQVLVRNTTIFSFLVIGVWIGAGLLVSKKFSKLTPDKL